MLLEVELDFALKLNCTSNTKGASNIYKYLIKTTITLLNISTAKLNIFHVRE